MKHLFTLLIAFLLPLLSYADDSGTCGDGLSYTYEESTQTLTITGNGAMLDCSGNNAPWHSYRADLKTIIITEGVTTIGDYAFSGCSGLTSIDIPESVTSIGGSAFRSCGGLTSVTISNSVTNIGGYAFYNCSNLLTVELNSDAIVSRSYWQASLGGYIFGYQVKEYIIGDNVNSIGDGAFYGCKDLKSVTIGKSVTNFGKGAFGDCSNLKRVELNSNAIVSKTDSNSPLVLKNIFGNQVKEYIIGDNVTGIGIRTFEDCNLTSITIPKSVKSIEKSSFYNCKSAYVYISDIESWFNYSSSPRAQHLFLNGSELHDLVIPNTITSIRDYCFYNCKGLTSITIPESVTSIGNYAFFYCSGLSSVTIPASVTSIGNYAFSCCSGLTSITIPEGLKSIESYTFHQCSCLSSVTIPESVTSIGNYAFSDCRSLTSVTIPENVTSIGKDAFHGCSRLLKVELNSNGFVALGSSLGAIFGSQVTEYFLSNNVTNIGDNAFSYCTDLTFIKIPESVTTIGNDAFRGCSSLTSIAIPNGVTSISNNSFYGCNALASITIPESVTTIGDNSFFGCSSLTSITISKCLTYIGNSAFNDCTSLNSVNISDCESWFKISFDNNTSNPLYYAQHLILNGSEIKELVIPNTVTFISDYCFNNCSGLTSIDIPESVTSIGGSAFRGCSGLTTVTIPESVTSIGTDAFSDCSNMETITYLSSSPFILDKAIFPTQFKVVGTLYVPTGARQTYVERGWSMYFLNIVELGDDTTRVNSVAAESDTQVLFNNHSIIVQGADDDTPIQVYDLNGRLIGQTKAAVAGTTKFAVPSGEKMLIVKVGNKSVKVVR